MPMQSRAMGTYRYCAPEYSRLGQLTTKADVYGFGVVLLELIIGRRALDTTRPVDEKNLVTWATPIFRDPKKYPDMAVPLLRKRFPERGLNQTVAMAAMCLQEESAARPLMSDLVTALSFLSVDTEEKIPQNCPPSQGDNSSKSSETESKKEEEEEDDSSHSEGSASSSWQSSRRSDDGTVSSSKKIKGKSSKKSSLFTMSRKSSKYSECKSFS
ncbi:hypothetical protein SLA2020_328540 [Shorea laevis]